ncbi:MAG: phospholipase D family protein [Gammaproteobacteria bacterium]|nr:MAG: phospholipase D family protein [Gammaproteobacteria bacterium]
MNGADNGMRMLVSRKTLNKSCKRLFLLSAILLLASACSSPVRPHDEPVSLAIASAQGDPGWDDFLDYLPSREDTSWFSTLNTGEVSLQQRLALIDTATTSIDAQYFLWLEDAVGSLSFERLLHVADRGVRVRLLLDDSFLAGEDAVVLAIDEHPNIEVRIYNPFEIRTEGMLTRYIENLNDLSRTNHRMHNKLLIGDSTVAIVGGRNIADEYFGFGRERNFRDYDVFVAGKILPDLSSGFDIFWNSGWSLPVPEVEHRYANDEDMSRLRMDLRASASKLDNWQIVNCSQACDLSDGWQKLASAMIQGEAELLLDLPRFDQQTPEQVAIRISDILSKTNEEVLAVTAYLVPSDALIANIQVKTDEGVSVRFLTNSLASNNHVPAHTAYAHHRKALLQAGADISELRPDGLDHSLYETSGYTAKQFGLHGKVIIFDNNTVFIGTLNIDPRSMVLNTEMGLLIHSPKLNAQVRKDLLPGFSMRNSWLVKMDDEGKLSWHSHDGVLHSQPSGTFERSVMDLLLEPLPIDDQM